VDNIFSLHKQINNLSSLNLHIQIINMNQKDIETFLMDIGSTPGGLDILEKFIQLGEWEDGLDIMKKITQIVDDDNGFTIIQDIVQQLQQESPSQEEEEEGDNNAIVVAIDEPPLNLRRKSVFQILWNPPPLPELPLMPGWGFQWEETIGARIFGVERWRFIVRVSLGSMLRQCVWMVLWTAGLVLILMGNFEQPVELGYATIFAFILALPAMLSFDLRIASHIVRSSNFWLNTILGIIFFVLSIEFNQDLRILPAFPVAIAAPGIQLFDAFPPYLSFLRQIVAWSFVALFATLVCALELDIYPDTHTEDIKWGEIAGIPLETNNRRTMSKICLILLVIGLRDAIHMIRFGKTQFNSIQLHVKINDDFTDRSSP